MNQFTVFFFFSMMLYVKVGNTYELDFIVQFLQFNTSTIENEESRTATNNESSFNIHRRRTEEYKDIWKFFENTSSTQIIITISISIIIIVQIVIIIIIFATKYKT